MQAIYLDDLNLHSRTWNDHQRQLRHVFQVLLETTFYAKLSKCALLQPEVDFCWLRLNAEGVTARALLLDQSGQRVEGPHITQLYTVLLMSLCVFTNVCVRPPQKGDHMVLEDDTAAGL